MPQPVQRRSYRPCQDRPIGAIVLYQAENATPCRRSLRKRERSAFVTPRDTARRRRAPLVIDVGSMPPLAESYGPFKPEVIRPVLTDNQAGAVIWVVVGRAREPRLEPAKYVDAGREITPDAAEDERGVHGNWGTSALKTCGVPGTRIISRSFSRSSADVAVPRRVDHSTPARHVARPGPTLVS